MFGSKLAARWLMNHDGTCSLGVPEAQPANKIVIGLDSQTVMPMPAPVKAWTWGIYQIPGLLISVCEARLFLSREPVGIDWSP